jgi:hypothetical protein
VDGLLHALIRIHFNLAVGRPKITDWQTVLQFASPYLLSNGFHGSLAQQVQFELARGPLEPKQEPVIDKTRIVDTIRVHNHGAHHAA